MQAAVLVGPGRLETAALPVPDHPELALVAVETVGVCGTDIAVFNGAAPVTYPRILGHELVGRVVRAAPGGRVPVGHRVLVNPSVSCGRCRECRGDAEYRCVDGGLAGRESDGGLAEYLAAPDNRLLPVPESLTPPQAGLLQVLGTCVHALSQVEVVPGDAAVVVGLGVAGLLMVQLLRARGITRVVGVTRSPTKQDLGRRLGAERTVGPADAAAAVAEVTDGQGAELVIEAVGHPATFAQAVHLAAPGATVLLYGIIPASNGAAEVPWYELYRKELTVRSPRAARHRDYQRAIDLVTSGVVDPAPLWSASFPLVAAEQALAAAQDPGVLKVTVDVRG